MFGRVTGFLERQPASWKNLPAEIADANFSEAYLNSILERRKKTPIKPLLLDQEYFPGVGNWMADEILWQAGLSPHRHANSFSKPELRRLFKSLKFICAESLKTIGRTYGKPPKGWLFHQRWSGKGTCPKHKSPLKHEVIRGRTAAWCPRCQKWRLEVAWLGRPRPRAREALRFLLLNTNSEMPVAKQSCIPFNVIAPTGHGQLLQVRLDLFIARRKRFPFFGISPVRWNRAPRHVQSISRPLSPLTNEPTLFFRQIQQREPSNSNRPMIHKRIGGGEVPLQRQLNRGNDFLNATVTGE
jgi:hypothetical protein